MRPKWWWCKRPWHWVFRNSSSSLGSLASWEHEQPQIFPLVNFLIHNLKPLNQYILILCCYSVSQSCLALCNSMDCSSPGFPVLHHLLELAQTHVCDAIQPSHPLSPHFPLALNLSQHQGEFFPMSQLSISGGQSFGASASSISPSNEYSGLISFRIDWWSCCP